VIQWVLNMMIWCRHFYNVLFKRLYAKLSLRSFAKREMDRNKFCFDALEIEITQSSPYAKLPDQGVDLITGQQTIFEKEITQFRRHLREVIRTAFIRTTLNILRHHLCNQPYEFQIKFKFLVENYAFVLFPPFSLIKTLSDDYAGEDGNSGDPGDHKIGDFNAHKTTPI